MNRRLIGIICLVAGALLLYFGYSASQSITESLTESLTGRFSDETMLYLIGGAVALVAGLALLLRK